MAANLICAIPGCGKAHFGRGYCHNHHYRLWKHGDPLGGRTEKGAPKKFYEEVVLLYDGDECLIWPFYKDASGYGKMQEGKRPQTVSRIVCEETNGPAPSPAHQAAHSCGNGHLGCVNKRHVSWKTPIANNSDKLVHGTHNRGSRHNMARLSEEEVGQIISLKGSRPQTEIAKMFGISQAHVSRIHLGQSWRP